MPKGDRLKLKADPDDGTTPIANLLLEAVAMAKISGLQKGAILYLWRRTYGWTDDDGRRKKEEKIPLSEWKRALDSSSPRVSATLSELELKGIIKRRTADMWGGYYYSINTDISNWNHESINLSKLCDVVGIPNFATITESVTVTHIDNSSPNSNGTVTENVTEQLPKTELPTILYKEILNKDLNKDNGNKKIVVNKEYDNVTMTTLEYQKLIDKFGEQSTIEKIANLSFYKKSKGRKYRDDYATIMTWERNDRDGKHQNNSTANQNDPDRFIKGKYGHLIQH